MTRTTVGIDDRLLADAMDVVGTTTKKATVNAALEWVARAAGLDEPARLNSSGAMPSQEVLDSRGAAAPMN